jgi:predicted transcriptional regulator of viral defense system
MKKYVYELLMNHKDEIERILDSSTKKIYKVSELKTFLRELEFLKTTDYHSVLNVKDIVDFLIKKKYLACIKFRTPRTENLYVLNIVNEYQLMIVLRPEGYYSHLSALYLHGLSQQDSDMIYFNQEQPFRSSSASLDQSRIDMAFKNKQRITSARTEYNGKTFWLLSGKQTGNYGVIVKTLKGIKVPVTDLERTLIDIVVRPAYSGGVGQVLQAYKLAQPNVSIEKLIETLHKLNYAYPYYQSVGFYIEKSGVYDSRAIQSLASFKELNYDFYLDYQIDSPSYSKKWRIYYPKYLDEIVLS